MKKTIIPFIAMLGLVAWSCDKNNQPIVEPDPVDISEIETPAPEPTVKLYYATQTDDAGAPIRLEVLPGSITYKDDFSIYLMQTPSADVLKKSAGDKMTSTFTGIAALDVVGDQLPVKFWPKEKSWDYTYISVYSTLDPSEGVLNIICYNADGSVALEQSVYLKCTRSIDHVLELDTFVYRDGDPWANQNPYYVGEEISLSFSIGRNDLDPKEVKMTYPTECLSLKDLTYDDEHAYATFDVIKAGSGVLKVIYRGLVKWKSLTFEAKATPPAEVKLKSLKVNVPYGEKRSDGKYEIPADWDAFSVYVAYEPSNTTQRDIVWSSNSSNVTISDDGKVLFNKRMAPFTVTATSKSNSSIYATVSIVPYGTYDYVTVNGTCGSVRYCESSWDGEPAFECARVTFGPAVWTKKMMQNFGSYLKTMRPVSTWDFSKLTLKEEYATVSALGMCFLNNEYIKAVKLPEDNNVLSSFDYCPNLFFASKVSFDGLSNSLNGIRSNGYYNCMDINVKYIKGCCLNDCEIHEIDFSNKLTEISGSILNDCPKLTKVVFHSKTPPTVKKWYADDSYFINEKNAFPTIYVPAGSLEAYWNCPLFAAYTTRMKKDYFITFTE